MSDNKFTKSQYFRVTYSNVFTIKFNGSEAGVVFSTLNDFGNPLGGSEDQVEVGMHVSNFKSLGMIISALVTHHEALSGSEILVSENVHEQLKNILGTLPHSSKS